MKIIILGPFNSGTNLIEKIFINHDIIYNETIYWKHTILIDTLCKLCEIKDVIIIIMYRNIYNWLNSINNTKYLFLKIMKVKQILLIIKIIINLQNMTTSQTYIISII
jgi:hypothetical protein